VAVLLFDAHQVVPPDVDGLVALVHHQAGPMMEVGSSVSCEVAPDLGYDVDVLTMWSFTDSVEWDHIRPALNAAPPPCGRPHVVCDRSSSADRDVLRGSIALTEWSMAHRDHHGTARVERPRTRPWRPHARTTLKNVRYRDGQIGSDCPPLRSHSSP
jgi:hypothetical protein